MSALLGQAAVESNGCNVRSSSLCHSLSTIGRAEVDRSDDDREGCEALEGHRLI